MCHPFQRVHCTLVLVLQDCGQVARILCSLKTSQCFWVISQSTLTHELSLSAIHIYRQYVRLIVLLLCFRHNWAVSAASDLFGPGHRGEEVD
jgi:hypothetical protein